MVTDFCRQARFCIALFFCFAPILQSYADEVERYRFEEGEPLTYKTTVNVVVDSARESKYFEHLSKSNAKTNVTFDLAYQLLPIAREQWWKVRLVLDEVKRTIRRGGDVQTAVLDRAKLKSRRLTTGDMLNINVWELDLPSEPNGESESEYAAKPAQSQWQGAKIDKAEKVSVPEDLFDRPILTWFASDGTLQGFEDRTEAQEIMEGLNLKECIKLLITPLPSKELKPGVSWTREEDVDLPEPPLKGEKYEPLKLELLYAVKSTERAGESRCARIAVHGRFSRDGLWIPIGQEKRKYLIWTTYVTKLENCIDGELVYDLEQKLMRASSVSNVYHYSTTEARKVDNYRGKVLMDTRVQARITSALVEPSQMEATLHNDKSALADTNSAPSDGPEVQILTAQTLNKTAEKTHNNNDQRNRQ
jgi:hypothetical protein